ncbi:hypothetical protein Trydic_g21636 [Trypoxylus dichotomus]
MKVLLLTLLALGGVFAEGDRNPNVRLAEDNIMAFFDCLREIGRTGSEEFAIPVMDPLFVAEAYSDLAVDVGTTGLSGTALVTNVAITGILGFEYYAISGTVNIIPPRYNFDATLRFPRLDVAIDEYDVNIVHEQTNTNLYGKGTIAFVATDLFVRLKLSFYLLGVPIQDVSLVPSVYGFESFVITGLFNDEEYSAQLSNDFLNNPSGSMANIAGTIDAVFSPILTEVFTDAWYFEDDSNLITQCAFP